MADTDLIAIQEFMKKNWGGEPLVVHGKKYYPSSGDMEGLVLTDDKQSIKGFLIYESQGKSCEIIVFEVFDKFKGFGTMLLNEFIKIAKTVDCAEILVMTTNDNLDALRFYQRRGFIITGIALNEFKNSRKMKPSIPELGDYKIPLRDEIMLALPIK